MCYNGIFKMKKLLGNDIIKKSKITSQYMIFSFITLKRVEKFTLCSKTQIPNFHNWVFFPSNCLIKYHHTLKLVTCNMF